EPLGSGRRPPGRRLAAATASRPDGARRPARVALTFLGLRPCRWAAVATYACAAGVAAHGIGVLTTDKRVQARAITPPPQTVTVGGEHAPCRKTMGCGQRPGPLRRDGTNLWRKIHSASPVEVRSHFVRDLAPGRARPDGADVVVRTTLPRSEYLHLH